MDDFKVILILLKYIHVYKTRCGYKREFYLFERFYIYFLKKQKDGVPRTAYKGVVRIYQDSKIIYIVPSEPWNGYNSMW